MLKELTELDGKIFVLTPARGPVTVKKSALLQLPVHINPAGGNRAVSGQVHADVCRGVIIFMGCQ